MINSYGIPNGGKYFGITGSQNYLVFQPFSRYITGFRNTNKNFSWRLKGISEESITPQSAIGHSFDSEIIYICCKVKTKFNGICLKQDSVSFIHGNVVNLYLFYELNTLRD